MVHNILLQKFNNIKLTELTGGYTNTTLLLEGSNPLVMAKIFNKENRDAGTEITSLTFLESSGVTPRIHDYFEDNEWLYIIMDYVHGVNGQQFLEHRAIDKAREIYKLLGIHLARDIHSLKRKESNIDLPIYGLLNVGIDDFDFITSDLKRVVKQNLNISVVGEHSLIHGDYGPHNTILSNESIFIIDWEWAGWGNPLQDVAWVVWFVHLHYPHFSKELSEIFLNAYSGFSDMQITNELVKAYSTSRVINILDRIKYANIDVKNEWVKRLEWTLQTNFI